MSYLVLARKYRPSQFEEVKGQEHVVRTLKNSIERGKIAHAYLFCGPRGVGKTSVARILSKALNAPGGPTTEVDPSSQAAQEIDKGNSLAVREIDGASHNSVDNVRELIESFRAAPPPGYSYKVYIIDEVHMLSNAAFNALLKSLEEPPPGTVFILATTEPQKIPDTVISRCQRFDFRSLSPEQIAKHLGTLCDNEGIAYEEDALSLIARLAEGSIRDSQSLLDRVIAFSSEKIRYEDACDALGSISQSLLLDLTQHIVEHNAQDALQLVGDVFASGADPVVFLRYFAGVWRELLLAKFGGEAALKRIGVPAYAQEKLLGFAEELSSEDVQDLAQIARDGCDRALRSSHARYSIEALVVRLASREPVASLAEIASELLRGNPQLLKQPERKQVAYQAPKAAAKPALREEAEGTPPETLKSEPSEEPSPEPAPLSSGSGGQDFERFVSSLGEEAGRMFVEQLKRTSSSVFSSEAVEISGPAFVIDYFDRAEAKKKLASLLQEFFQTPVARLALKRVEGSVEKKANPSLRDKQKRKEAEDKLSRVRSVMERSEVQAIKKVFPGSEVQKVILKKSET